MEWDLLRNFINAIKSPATKVVMKSPLEDILTISNKRPQMTYSYMHSSPRYIESQIIDYIMSLRNNQVSYATIQHLIAPIFTFYQLNDVILNRRKVSRYMGEYKRVIKDHTYTTEQIQQALQTADVRVRMVILLLSSTGARIGSLPRSNSRESDKNTPV